MRRLLAITLVLCVMLCGFAEAMEERGDIVDFDGPIIEDFPADGICTGNNVRYRSGPGTDYEVLGRLYKSDEVRLRGSETDSEGNVWYRIDNPSGRRGSVWVASWYIDPLE